ATTRLAITPGSGTAVARSCATAKSSVEVSTTRLNAIVLVPANRRAPAVPSTPRTIWPTWARVSKKGGVIVSGVVVFGWASRPKVVKKMEDLSVRDVKPFVQRTRGVAPSVFGTAPQVVQVPGTVKATRGMSGVMVTGPLLREATTEPSG